MSALAAQEKQDISAFELEKCAESDVDEEEEMEFLMPAGVEERTPPEYEFEESQDPRKINET